MSLENRIKAVTFRFDKIGVTFSYDFIYVPTYTYWRNYRKTVILTNLKEATV